MNDSDMVVVNNSRKEVFDKQNGPCFYENFNLWISFSGKGTSLKRKSVSSEPSQVITTAQLYSTKPELRFYPGSNPARNVPEIRDGEDL